MTKKFIFFTIAITISITALSLQAKDNKIDKKRKAIAKELQKINFYGGDYLGYSNEILRHLYNIHNIGKGYDYYSYRNRRNRRRARRNSVDTYSLLSGGLAIRESLQMETISASDSKSGIIKISSLKGPVIKSHPFKEMIGNRKVKYFPLAKHCPEDFYYLHFNNMTGALNFFDYLGNVGGALHKRFSPQSVDFMLKEKILTQLGLKENKLSRNFYNIVIKELVITGSDPFINEGSDITLIYKIRNSFIFNTTINSYRKSFKKRFNAKSTKLYISGFKADYISTKDKKLNSYLIKLPNNIVLISNSKKAASIVIDTFKKKHPSMANADDFRYMRTIYPANEKLEDGFLYLSDSFIRRLVGPEVRIKEARRMNTTMRMAKLEKYILYYHHLTGKAPKDFKEVNSILKPKPLSKNKFIEIKKIKSHDLYWTIKNIDSNIFSWYSFRNVISKKLLNQRKYNYAKKQKVWKRIYSFVNYLKQKFKSVKGHSPNTPYELMVTIRGESDNIIDGTDFKIHPNGYSVISEKYGRTGFMTSNIDTKLEYVSEKESKNYKRFLKEYNNFWKEFFDPIGVRFKLNDGIKIDTCILPLINNSIYNQIQALFGGNPIKLNSKNIVKGDIFSLVLKLNITKEINSAFSKFLYAFSGRNKEFRKISLNQMIKGEIQFHMNDTNPLVDFDGSRLTSSFMRGRLGKSDMFFGLMAWSFFHPIRVSIPLKDKKLAEQFLNVLDRYFLYGNRKRYLDITNYKYKHNSLKIRVSKVSIFNTISFRIYYTIKNNTLHIASTEKYMKKILSSRSKLKRNRTSSKGNIIAVYRPGQMVLEKDLFKANIMESAQQSSFKNFGTLLLMKDIFKNSNNIPNKIFKYYGFKPVCPMGGKYSFNKKDKIYNSVFGSRLKPVIDYKKISSDMFDRYFSTEEIKLELEFTKEGIKTKILTR